MLNLGSTVVMFSITIVLLKVGLGRSFECFEGLQVRIRAGMKPEDLFANKHSKLRHLQYKLHV